MTGNAIEISDLRKKYHETEVLRGINATVAEGSICGFLGPNGAGKTTTMRILMGLAQPSGGQASVLGYDVRRFDLLARSRIGYLPQDPVFPPGQTVRGVVTYVARLYGGHARGRALRQRVEELLDRVGMTDRADRKVRALSGGERQRLGVAQALVSNPDLVILDEPSAGLDPSGRQDLLELISSVGQHATVFYSTHILDDVERVSDSVIVINLGRVIAQGPLSSILTASATDYMLRLRGATTDVRSRLAAQEWVNDIKVAHRGDIDVWRVRIAEGAHGEALIPTLLADDDCEVLEYHLSDRRLEDDYLDLIGADHGN